MPFPYSAMLHDQRILVVEDSHLVAQELTETLEREGADVIGPVFTIDDARCLAFEASLDAAVLDVKLHGQMIWPVADILCQRHVRLVFATGYPAASIRKRYKYAKVAEKPAPARLVARLLSNQPPVAGGI